MSISSKYPSVRPAKVINLNKKTLLNSNVEYSRGGVGTYVDENGFIVSAIADQPRFTHNPETLEYEGLLLEEARTNYFPNSSLPTGTVNGVKTTVSGYLLPDGTTGNCTQLYVDRVSNNLYDGFQTVPGNKQFHFSFWIQNISGFDITFSYGRADAFRSQITLPSDGKWHRLSRDIGSSNSIGQLYNLTYVDTRPGGSTNPVSTPFTVLLWGSQCEVGLNPTSYIPTSGSAVTRPADLISVSSVSNVKSGRIKFSSVASNSYSPYFTLKDSTSPAKPYVLELGSVNSAPVASVVYNSVRQGTTSFASVPGTGVPNESTLSFNFEPTTGAVEISSTASDDADSHVLSLPADLSRPLPADQTLDLFSVESKSFPLSLKEIYLWETALTIDQLASVSGELRSIGQPVEPSTGINENSDYADAGARPTLDLRFAERKDLFDDTTEQNLVTFSRGSTATYTDENGVIQTAVADEPRFDHDPTTGESLGLLVEESRTNLIRQSIVRPDLPGQTYSFWTSFTTGTVTQANAALAPDNTFTAALVENLTTSIGDILARYEIALSNVSGLIDSIWIKSVSGTTTISLFGSPTGQETYTPVTVGEEWTRVEMRRPASPNYFLKLRKNTSAPVSLYVWGGQTEIGTFKTSYIPTPATFTSRASTATYYDATGTIQTAAVNEARDNAYLPDENGVFHPAGLLLESAGTNLLTYSEQFETIEWVKSNVSVTPNAAVAPDGQTTADKLVENSVNASHIINNITATLSPAPGGKYYTFSVYAKSAGRDYIRLQMQVGSDATQWDFNLLNYSVSNTYSGWIGHNASCTPVGDDWVRCVLYGQAPSNGIQTVRGIIQLATANTNSYQGDSTSGVYLWGAQLEEGSYPTSYIPTTSSTVTRAADVSSSSTVTRSADVARITGSNFSSWYNYPSSTILIDGKPLSLSGNPRLITVSGSGGENRLWTTSRDFYTSSYAPGDGGMVLTSYPISTSYQRYAYSFDYDISTNTTTLKNTTLGQSVLSLSSSGYKIPLTGANLYLGSSGDSSGSKLIRRLTYWPTRLPDTTLQVLTDPAISTWDLIFDSSLSTDGTCAVVTASTCTYTIDWGDGTPVQTVNATGTGFTATHRYTFPQTYKAKIEVLSGAFRPYYNNSVYADQLLEIRQTPDGWTNTSTSGFGTNLQNAWYGADNLKVVNRELNTSGVTNLAGAWFGCSSLTNFPLIDTSDCTSFNTSWYNCTNLATFPSLDTSLVQSFYASWYNCINLTEFPLLNSSGVANFSTAWARCSNLTKFPLLNISTGGTFDSSWSFCTNLTTFPANFFDSWSATPVANCFVNTWAGCSSLTPTSVENILNSISISPSSSIPPASGKDITIGYNATITPGPDITVPAIDLLAKGWTPKLNNVTPDPYALASLDLDFATNLSLTDNISGNNLITFSRGSVGTYVDSSGVIQTATAGTPRFDHDPTTGESLGLLVEEQRTNLITYSEQFNTDWLLTDLKAFGSGSIVDAIEAPDGQVSADKITENNANNAHLITKVSVVTPPTATTTYTISVYVKAGERSRFQLKLYGSFTIDPAVNFDLVAGTAVIQQGNPGPTNLLIIPVGAGWYRCSFTVTTINTNPLGFQLLLQNDAGTTFYQGDDVSGLYVWGAQLEAGSFSTSYIPTSGATATRAADVVSITGTNFSSWYNNTEGTLFIDSAFTDSVDATVPFHFGAYSWAITPGIQQLRESVANTGIISLPSSINTFKKNAVALKSGDYAVSTDGGTVSTSTNSYSPTNLSDFSINTIGTTLNGRLSRLTYWPKRLTNTSLQYLTT